MFPLEQKSSNSTSILLSLAKQLHISPAAAAKSLWSCPTLCDPRDGSPPGFPIPGVLQARTLEWVHLPWVCPKPGAEFTLDSAALHASPTCSFLGFFPLFPVAVAALNTVFQFFGPQRLWGFYLSFSHLSRHWLWPPLKLKATESQKPTGCHLFFQDPSLPSPTRLWTYITSRHWFGGGKESRVCNFCLGDSWVW